MESAMLKLLKVVSVLIAIAVLQTATVQAGEMDKPVAARKAVMKLRVFYISQLGGMAKGKIQYDAKKAQGAADGLLALAKLDMSSMWPAGSGNDKLGDMTRAKPEIWKPNSGVGAKAKDLRTATEALAKVAGTGLDGLRGGIGAVGKSCGSCHKAFRVPKK